MRIPDEYVEAWRRDGYVVVEKLFSDKETAAFQRELHSQFPGWQEYAAAPELYQPDAGGGISHETPYLGHALNFAAIHPDIIDFVERALGTRDVLVTQSQLWARYAGVDDSDQSLHVDYMNNSLLLPPEDARPDQVTIILYHSDVDESLGPTFVIPKGLTRGIPLVPYLRSRRQYPELYGLERPVKVPAGSLLLYDTRTFHRGSALKSARGVRFTQHIAYRRADAPWLGFRAWAPFGLVAEMQELLERASPRQREMFGFPAPGHSYWNEETLAGMAARYPNLDLAPYAEAVDVDASVIAMARERMRSVQPLSVTTSNTGTVSALGYVREALHALRPHMPAVSAYYEGILDYYDALRRGSEAASPVMLNLGCAHELLPGFINVDIVAGPGVQVANLREAWPWQDSSVDYIYASNVIEHLPDKILTMNELWRTLRPGGTVLIAVPTTAGSGAWQDPTHVSYWNSRSFLYFEQGSPYREGFAQRYGIKATFRTLWSTTVVTPDGPQLAILLEAVKP